MGLLRRLSDVTRANLNDLTRKTMGAPKQPVSEWTDAELEDELLRRRRERAARGGQASGGGGRGNRTGLSPQAMRIAQFYANLELAPGAAAAEVRKAYRDLMRRYHPDKHVGDPERHRAATELAESLTRAYKGLLEHLKA